MIKISLDITEPIYLEEILTTENGFDLDHPMVKTFRVFGLQLMAAGQGSTLRCPEDGGHLLPVTTQTLVERLNDDATTQVVARCPVHEQDI